MTGVQTCALPIWPISCLAFGPDSSELFSGSFDRSIMQWNAEDRTYMNCLYGHQNEILTMDALNKDRLLTVARDRTMHLWKVLIVLMHLCVWYTFVSLNRTFLQMNWKSYVVKLTFSIILFLYN